jgi:general secretion pathway protein E
MPQLHIHEGDTVRTVSVPDGKITLGRRADNDVVLTDERASRYHCAIEPSEAGFILTDLGSRNGTRLNGSAVSKAPIGDGDEIRIGQTRITFQLSDDAEDEGSLTLLEEFALAEEVTEAEDIPVATIEGSEGAAPPESAATIEQMAALAGLPIAKELHNVASVGRDVGFDMNAIEMLDAHRKTVHAAGALKEESHAVHAFRAILYGAFRTRSTDIHFEPRGSDFQIRFRVDGTMIPVMALPNILGQGVLSTVKILCGLDIAKRHVVQEGNFSAQVPGRQIDFRISYTPTMHGQKLAIRVLDKTVMPASLADLNMPTSMLRALRAACNSDSGMVIVSGPTGSGKTTSLYTAIRSLDATTRNIVTIEDPIEYQLDGITQIAAEARGGLSFADLLKSILRQDPDVILLGEIRDAETARTAMQAAMTGHLVFTTLHARDTVGTVFRLIDLGVEPYMIANAVSMCLSQRLLRVLCTSCRKSFRPGPSHLIKMKMENKRVERLYAQVGCRECMQTGFRGRTPIFEMLQFNDELRDILITKPSIQQIRKAAGEWTFQTLLDSGYAKTVEGVTTIEEVDRVANMG